MKSLETVEEREKWKRVKSKGKKIYILKSLILYEIFVLIIATIYLMFDKRDIFSNFPLLIFTYLVAIIVYSPLGIWVGNNSWNAKVRRFEE
ncbi:hypothetical protein AM500_04755 [Bacillus sp. FJAT-18017]|uniref:hypothetical protein n=1 Tax=Bacillus sp. FJAT-18017 TaxID=1705566 RepID=UPI0006ADF00A|nr:hypothetical protein [Bacillus sp. FJAT-18017]ALC89176.1 hypothetical protein AM500_04755 [Bacillus sp. FJAT-18017]